MFNYSDTLALFIVYIDYSNYYDNVRTKTGVLISSGRICNRNGAARRLVTKWRRPAVTDPRDGRRVALKKLPNVFQSLVSSKRVFRELKMLCFFKHENGSPDRRGGDEGLERLGAAESRPLGRAWPLLTLQGYSVAPVKLLYHQFFVGERFWRSGTNVRICYHRQRRSVIRVSFVLATSVAVISLSGLSILSPGLSHLSTARGRKITELSGVPSQSQSRHAVVMNLQKPPEKVVQLVCKAVAVYRVVLSDRGSDPMLFVYSLRFTGVQQLIKRSEPEHRTFISSSDPFHTGVSSSQLLIMLLSTVLARLIGLQLEQSHHCMQGLLPPPRWTRRSRVFQLLEDRVCLIWSYCGNNWSSSTHVTIISVTISKLWFYFNDVPFWTKKHRLRLPVLPINLQPLINIREEKGTKLVP
ncbi:hypothetical protein J6590_037914 [Homalodisca vitripennis]|nr:hypothetical protein J6590_037914 [Homalodisca vitripennis]